MRADIQMTESAQDYLSQVASNEGNTELRIGVSHPGTSLSQAFITFNKEQDCDDEVHQYAGFNLRYSRSLALFINGMAINYRKNRMGGNLHLKAPNIKVMPELPEDADLSLKVSAVLEAHVNPALAEHQGGVAVDRIEDNRVYLKFGGNCLGCGNAERTLVDFVEKTLKEHLPEIEAVSDVTRH